MYPYDVPLWSPVLLLLRTQVENVQVYDLEGAFLGGDEATCQGMLYARLL
jgi:hypothetical protein